MTLFLSAVAYSNRRFVLLYFKYVKPRLGFLYPKAKSRRHS